MLQTEITLGIVDVAYLLHISRRNADASSFWNLLLLFRPSPFPRRKQHAPTGSLKWASSPNILRRYRRALYGSGYFKSSTPCLVPVGLAGLGALTPIKLCPAQPRLDSLNFSTSYCSCSTQYCSDLAGFAPLRLCLGSAQPRSRPFFWDPPGYLSGRVMSATSVLMLSSLSDQSRRPQFRDLHCRTGFPTPFTKIVRFFCC